MFNVAKLHLREGPADYRVPYRNSVLELEYPDLRLGILATSVKPEDRDAMEFMRGHGYKGETEVHIAGRGKRKRTRAERMWMRRRSAVEPVIGHVKHDNRMIRNYLQGKDGDQMNAVPTGRPGLRGPLGCLRSGLKVKASEQQVGCKETFDGVGIAVWVADRRELNRLCLTVHSPIKSSSQQERAKAPEFPYPGVGICPLPIEAHYHPSAADFA